MNSYNRIHIILVGFLLAYCITLHVYMFTNNEINILCVIIIVIIRHQIILVEKK